MVRVWLTSVDNIDTCKGYGWSDRPTDWPTHWMTELCTQFWVVEFMHLVFTRMPGERYHRRLRSLSLSLCDVFRVLINSLVCRFCTSALGLVLFGFRLKGKYGYLFLKVKTHKRFKRTLFIRTKHNMPIFEVISIMKLQNDTLTTVKRWKTVTNEMAS